MVKKKKTTKKRKPKGKLLSEALNEKADVARNEAGDDESEPVAEPYQEASIEAPLQSEPPPRWSDDDDAAELSDDDDRSAPSDADGDEDDYEDDYEDDAASEQPAGAAGSSDDDESDDDESDDDESDDDESDDDESDDDDDEWEDDDDDAAAQMGHRRYVISGFFALWIVVAYIAGQTLQAAWSWVASKDWAFEKLPQLAAVPHEGELISRSSVSLVVGGIIAGAVVIHYYVRPDIRTWADEVAEELSKVKWPNRKEIGNHTVVVIAATLVLTLYLTLLDRFWGFVTNLIYSSGA